MSSAIMSTHFNVKWKPSNCCWWFAGEVWTGIQEHLGNRNNGLGAPYTAQM